jgi:hypothetical protein
MSGVSIPAGIEVKPLGVTSPLESTEKIKYTTYSKQHDITDITVASVDSR